ncbi:hypothetical protein [Terrimonas pollutisoli]|uniref:hypothetical protein n=1 Tax=Terrimonas pollutisoli TaxID=3034147 RepID=UPI0023EB0246|nr:hypothetical protein [Terrimonas sp. H1YJ31]
MRLFEFEDLDWFPDFLRESMTDYLRFVLSAVNFYYPVTTIIREGLENAERFTIIDLCSGGGGAIKKIQKNFHDTYFLSLPVILTDKFPNFEAFHLLKKESNGDIDFAGYPVDAMNVPPELKGLRTIFSAFHHFNKEHAKLVLQDAVTARQPIAVFDGGDKNIFTVLGIIIFHPVIFFLFTPFFRPFRFSRIIFTYLVPLIPLCTIWDGVVSIMRLYKPAELLVIANSINNHSFTWKAGNLKNKFGMKVTYLLGYPEISA